MGKGLESFVSQEIVVGSLRGDPRVSFLDLSMSREVSQECVDKEISHG